jgi:hypothetical protein
MPDANMPDRRWFGARSLDAGPNHPRFIQYVMSDVYALMDYLSGRAWPSLEPLPRFARANDPPPHADVTDVSGCSNSDCDLIDRDLSDRSRLFCRAMRIGQELGSNPHEINPADAAFLIRVRDHLNVQASPATGSSIAFTIRAMEGLLDPKMKHEQKEPPGYIIPDPALDGAAFRLAEFVKCRVTMSLVVLSITVALSTYVACGKLLLDTRDAVNRDFGTNLAAIAVEVGRHQTPDLAPSGESQFHQYPPSQIPDPRIDQFCYEYVSNISVDQACHQREELKVRKQNIHNLLRYWMFPFQNISSDEQVAQWAATSIAVVGNYLLPVFYGLLGALGFVLRRLNRQLSDYLLTPRDLRANLIRIRLGMMTGACIGLFVNSSTGAATLTGIGGAAVTLTASSIAFLAGYGVEVVFKMLDGLMNLIFKIGEARKGNSHA